jgi:hypothetical protein
MEISTAVDKFKEKYAGRRLKKGYQVFSPAPKDIWKDLVKDDDRALIFQTSQWMDCLSLDGHYKDCSRLYEYSRGKRILLPLVRRCGFPNRFSMLSSLPHGWGMGGPILTAPAGHDELMLMLDDLRSLNYSRLSIRQNPLMVDPFKMQEEFFDTSIEHISHILDLRDGFDHFWSKTLSCDTRTKIRKVEKSSVIIEIDKSENAITSYYKLYMRWLDNRAKERKIPRFIGEMSGKWREPKSKFLAVKKILGEKCQVWIAKLDQQPIVAAILLINGSHAFCWRTCNDRQFLRGLPANYLLQKFMIEESCNSGCRYYHLGESGGVQSLMHFKERFGAVGFRCKEYYLERLPLTTIQQSLTRVSGKLETVLLRNHA